MRMGIDIGGMTIKLGLVEGDSVIAKKIIGTDSGIRTSEEIIENMADAAIGLLQENNLTQADCPAMGIACPGLVDAGRGIVLYSNNIGWENVPILEILARHVQIPAALANDADAAALGEVLYGAARGKNNAVLLTLGTGVGGGVVMDRKIFSGYMRGGCELGHTVIERNGKICTCGRKGCLEVYASATALMELARDAAAENGASLMNKLCGNDLSKLDGRIVFEAEKQGDETAARVIGEYEENLSIGIANITNIFRPEVIILGGGVSAQKEYLTDALQKKVEKMCFGAEHGEIPRIVTSQLGNDAGMIGAAFLR